MSLKEEQQERRISSEEEEEEEEEYPGHSWEKDGEGRIDYTRAVAAHPWVPHWVLSLTRSSRSIQLDGKRKKKFLTQAARRV
jgi:hypothetical protein